MRFELLPNEVLIECFDYFTISEIFHSFDRLNHRFNQLIRNLPFHLKYHHDQKLIFDHFCRKIVSEPEIKNQIYSIDISNENSCNQIETFLSWFSLEEFPHLRTLVLTGVDQNHALKLKPMLPALTQLEDLHLIKSNDDTEQLVPSSLTSKLRRLTIRSLPQSIQVSHTPCSITHLTLSSGNSHHIFIILEHVPWLVYLNIKNISTDYSEEQSKTFFPTAGHCNLKKLALTNYHGAFEALELLATQIPNLHSLIMITNNNEELVDAPRWEHLIKSSLQKLSSFKFEFYCSHRDDLLDRFEQFQSHFWQEAHPWYTNYSFTRFYAIIHTVPFLKHEFTLHKFSTKYEQNQSNNFIRVRELKLDYNAIDHEGGYSFPNVRSLTICHDSPDKTPKSNEQILRLPLKINLSNVQHLTISNIPEESVALTLSLICQNAPRLSSLCLEPCDLRMLINHTEVCSSLHGNIHIFDSKNRLLFKNDDDIHLFCRIFTNIKRLQCLPIEIEQLSYLLDHLPHLTMIEIFTSAIGKVENLLSSLTEHRPLFSRTFHTEKISCVDRKSYSRKKYGCCLWINSN